MEGKMKDILYFYLPTCPHCAKATKEIEEIRKEHPEYAAVKVQMVDESANEDFAAKFDYNYVPCMYLDGDKKIGGQCDKDKLLALFKEAKG